MRHQLRIQLRSCEGAILRAIGMMERRGYRLENCTVHEAQGDGQAMEAEVSSERPVALLQRQLERLHDVLWVEVKTPASGWAEQAVTRPISGSR
jgi:acetolactate synthase II small subunit